MEKHLLTFATGAGGASEKIGPAYGELLQVRWKYASGDTGGSIRLQIVPDNDADEANDTGLNVTFAELNLAGGDWLRAPRIPVVGPGILDTGVGDERVPALVTLEHIKATLTPGGASGTTGRLWLTIGGGK